MKYDHALIGWITTSIGLALVAGSFVIARKRGFTTVRFIIDCACVLVAGLVGAALIFVFLKNNIQPGWGMGGLIFYPLVTALGAAPFLLCGLYLGEKIQPHRATSFFIGTAIAGLICATLISLVFSAILSRTINGPGGGSYGGWEIGLIPLIILSPMLWVCLFVGFYPLAFSSRNKH